MLYILTQMERIKYQKLELFHQPQFTLSDALTGPDILHPTHQVVTVRIKLRRDSVERMFQENEITLKFSDQFGADMEIPVLNLEYSETSNQDILTVLVTALFPLDELYRIKPTNLSDQ